VAGTARPWSRIVAILVASYVTLIGMIVRLDPDVILMRATIAALIFAILTRILTEIVPGLKKLNG